MTENKIPCHMLEQEDEPVLDGFCNSSLNLPELMDGNKKKIMEAFN